MTSRRIACILAAASATAAACSCHTVNGQQLSNPIRITIGIDSISYPQGDFVYNSVDHEFLAVYEVGDGYSPSTHRAYAQRFSTNGTLIGPTFQVLDEIYGRWNEYEPKVSYNPTANQYFVTAALQDQFSYTAAFRTVGQILSAQGAPVGNTFSVDIAGINPVTLYNPASNQFSFVGQDGARNYRIFGRQLASDGSPLGNDFQIDQPNPAALWFESSVGSFAYNSNRHEYLNLHWSDWDLFVTKPAGQVLTSYKSVDRQIIQSDGTLRGSPLSFVTMEVAPGPGPYQVLEAAYNPNRQQYLFAYEYGGDVRGQFLDDDGIPTGSSFNLFHGYPNKGPFTVTIPDLAIAYDPIHDLYLLAVRIETKQIVGLLLDGQGQPMGSQFLLASTDFVANLQASYCEGVNGFAVAWSQENQSVYPAAPDFFVRFVSIPEPSTIVVGVLSMCCGLIFIRRRTA